jgi:hypothetical protein
VLHEHGGYPRRDSAFRHDRLDFGGDLIGAFAFCSKLKAFGISFHAWLNATNNQGLRNARCLYSGARGVASSEAN